MKILLKSYTLHLSDIVLILHLLYCWAFRGSALVLAVACENPKTTATIWLHRNTNNPFL